MHPALASTNPFQTSAASVMRAVEPAAAPVTRPTSAAAAEPISNSAPVPAQAAEPDVSSWPTCARVQVHEDAGETSGPIADQTDHISEIFVGARKIVWADEPPLREEPIPLFLTQAHIQLDQELTEFIASNWCRRRA